jgi:predicted GIY-YIG superfamily endonuclease
MKSTEIVYSGPPLFGARDFRPVAPTGYTRRYVYILSDASGIPLYVGRSWNPHYRMEKHRRKKPWWPDVAHMELRLIQGTDIHSSDRAVAEAEMYLIKSLRPLHNIVGVSR